MQPESEAVTVTFTVDKAVVFRSLSGVSAVRILLAQSQFLVLCPVMMRRKVFQHLSQRKDVARDSGSTEKDTSLSAVCILGSCVQSHVAMKRGLHCD